MSDISSESGFTLVELVTVVLIMGILTATASSRFFNLNPFQQKVVFDELISSIRYAHKLAIATSCNVQVKISSQKLELKRSASRSSCRSTTASDFTADTTRPGTDDSSYAVYVSDVSLTPTTFYFTALGTVSSGQTIQMSDGKTITVVQQTGYVYDSSP